MRTSKKQRIISYAIQKGFDEMAIKYLLYIIELSQSGMIDNYVLKHHERMISEVFEGDSRKCTETYVSLQKERLIQMKGPHLIILAWNDEHLSCLKYNEPMRKYSKDPVSEQVTLMSYFDQYKKRIEQNQRVQNIKVSTISSEQDNIPITYHWDKILGIKFPRSLSKYFTGKLSADDETKKYSVPDKIISQVEQCKLSKEMIRYLCGLISQCNTNGEIYDYSKSYSIAKMQELFDDKTLAQSTCYDVHDKLHKKGIIEEHVHTKAGVNCLKIIGYRDGFGKNKNYIIIPYAVFQRIFKELEIGSIRLFFDFVFKLNNGEDKGKVPGQNKSIYFKAFTTSWDTERDKIKYLQTLQWLRKRCKSEVLQLLFGCKARDALRHFFDFGMKDIEKGKVSVKIKSEYFVSKKSVEKLAIYIDPLDKYRTKVLFMRQVLEKCAFHYDDEVLRSFVHVLKKVNKRIICVLLCTLDIDIRTRKQNGWKRIENLGAYLHWLYIRYLKGDRVVLNSQINDSVNAYDEAMARISGYCIPDEHNKVVIDDHTAESAS